MKIDQYSCIGWHWQDTKHDQLEDRAARMRTVAMSTSWQYQIWSDCIEGLFSQPLRKHNTPNRDATTITNLSTGLSQITKRQILFIPHITPRVGMTDWWLGLCKLENEILIAAKNAEISNF